MNLKKAHLFGCILATFVILAHSVDYHCEPGYKVFGQYCYLFRTDVNRYADAVIECNSEDGHLVSIHSLSENTFLRSQVSGEFLIGMHYFDPPKTYNWSDATTVDYKNFTDGFEKWAGYFGFCAKMNADGQWANVDCEMDELKYVCRKKALSTPVSDNSACPSPSTTYVDLGELTSPGYPGAYGGNGSLNCTYMLMARNHDYISITVDEANIGSDHIYLYRTHNPTHTNLVNTITKYSINVTTLVHFNFVYVMFTSKGIGRWKLTWSTVETAETCEFSLPGESNQTGDYCFLTKPRVTTQYLDAILNNYHCLSTFRGELPSIHSDEEQGSLSRMRQYNYPYQLIGLRYYTDGEWKWLDDTGVDYVHFASDYRPTTDNSMCIFNFGNNLWSNSRCNDGRNYNALYCKKIATRVPIAPKDCMDPTRIYENFGEIYSPDYPAQHSGANKFFCQHHLRAKVGYLIYLYYTVIASAPTLQTISVHNGWTRSDESLAAELYDTNALVKSANNTNQVLVMHNTFPNALWSIAWYSTKDPTYIPALSQTPEEREAYENSDKWRVMATQPSVCPHLPIGSATYRQFRITSPDFPTGYPANTDCIYYSNSSMPLPAGYSWKIDFTRLKIGTDDYIKLVDMRTDTIFATTDTNIREGLELATSFEFSIEFHSGSAHSNNEMWRILQWI